MTRKDSSGRTITNGLRVLVDSPDCGQYANGQADLGIVVGCDHESDTYQVSLDMYAGGHNVARASHEMSDPAEEGLV